MPAHDACILHIYKIIDFLHICKIIRPVHTRKLSCADLPAQTWQVSTRCRQVRANFSSLDDFVGIGHVRGRGLARIFLLSRAQRTTKNGDWTEVRKVATRPYLTVRSSLRSFNLWHVEDWAGRSYWLARCTVFVSTRTLLPSETGLRRQICS